MAFVLKWHHSSNFQFVRYSFLFYNHRLTGHYHQQRSCGYPSDAEQFKTNNSTSSGSDDDAVLATLKDGYSYGNAFWNRWAK